MECPHCNTAYHDQPQLTPIGSDSYGHWAIEKTTCPVDRCGKMTLFLIEGNLAKDSRDRVYVDYARQRLMVYPEGTSRPPVPVEVTDEGIADDYTEACLVLAHSPKASAALSRRCLQHILRERAGVKKGDLASEIDQVLKANSLPSHLSASIDAVRNIGNFAAHPVKSTSTGEIVDVEPGEAEWTLDVIESLFDFYYVQPAILQRKKDELNAKLKDMGKPPMK